jgi:hypothetical protein
MTKASQRWILFGAVCAGFLVSWLWGYSQTYVKTVTVQVPVVKTVIKTETKTVSIQADLPAVCKDLQEQATLVYTSTGGMSKASGAIQLALNSLGRAAWKGDVAQINTVTVEIRTQNDRLAKATVDQADATTRFKKSLQSCEEALNE